MYLTQYDIIQDGKIEVPSNEFNLEYRVRQIENKLVTSNCRIATEISRRMLRYNSKNDFIKN